MRPPLTAQIGPDNHPFAEIPQNHVWDLVEYLNFHRPDVNYHFEKGYFTVTFLRQTLPHVQKLLDEWTSAEENNILYNDAEQSSIPSTHALST